MLSENRKIKRSWNTHVATQCAAVIIHLSLSKAPPQASFFVRNPVLIRATCQGCEPKPVEWPPTILLLRVYNSPQPKIIKVRFAFKPEGMRNEGKCDTNVIKMNRGGTWLNYLQIKLSRWHESVKLKFREAGINNYI